MGKKKKEAHSAPDIDVEMNMTPMIDIVFQMILFFIIITDFTQSEIALLELPWSTVGTEDQDDDPTRMIINITAPIPSNVDSDPVLKKKWPPNKRKEANKILAQGKDLDFVALYKYLIANGVQNVRYREEKNEKLCSRRLLLRCDGDQAFDYVKAVLQICAMPDVAIYKIEIATSEEMNEESAAKE